MVKVREIVRERIVNAPSSEYIEEVHRYVYECQNCLDDNDKPVRKAAIVNAENKFLEFAGC